VSLPCLLAVGCWTHRQEADSQAASLRSQASAREERLQAQFASRLAQLQSELDARCAAAADREGALAAAKDEISRLAIQVGTISREQGVAWSGQASWYKCSID
jgi:chromosome segregation ATPase